MRVRASLFCGLLLLAAREAPAGEPTLIPGTKWIGVGVDLLGLEIKADGYPKRGKGGRKTEWIIRGIEEGDEATEYVEATVAGEKFRIPKILRAKPDEQEHTRTYASTTTHELHTKTTTEYSLSGSYEQFSGSFSKSSSSSTSHLEMRYYAWSNDVHRTHILEIRDVDLQKHLSAGFKRRLHDPTVKPAKLFHKYGTHLVRAVAIGSRMEMFTVTNRTEDVSETDFRSAVEAGFAGFVSGRREFGGSETNRNIWEQCSTQKDSFGSDGNPAVIGFRRDEDSLVGIWELCDDPKRRAEIRDAYKVGAAIKAITTPVVFTVGPGNDVEDKYSPEIKLEVPESYAILSGGAKGIPGNNVGLLLGDSYPKDIRTWMARCKSARVTGKVAVAVVAIHDPDEHWEVRVFPPVPGKSVKQMESDLMVMVIPEQDSDNRYVFTGGGARLELEQTDTDPPVWLWYSAPHDAALRFDTNASPEDFTRAVLAHYGPRIGQPIDFDGWKAVSAQPHGRQGWATGHLSGYLIGVRPRSEYAKRVAVETKLFVDRTEHQTHMPEGQFHPPVLGGPAWTMVGGGALALGRYQYLCHSLPVLHSSGRLEWHAKSANVHKQDKEYLYMMAIGLRARVKS